MYDTTRYSTDFPNIEDDRMRALRALCSASLLVLGAVRLAAQDRPQFQPPPDHWVPFDSLSAALGLDAGQQAAVKPHYAVVDSLVRAAAEMRRQAFQGMQMGGGPPSDADRARMQEMRTKLQAMQDDADQHLGELKALLRDDQKTKLDALRQPMIRMRRPGGPPPGGF